MPDIKDTLAQRGARYGEFTDHANLVQTLHMAVNSREGFSRLNPVQRHALYIILDKIARIINGDPNYDDNWHDIAGYAKLVEDRINSAKLQPSVPGTPHPGASPFRFQHTPGDPA